MNIRHLNLKANPIVHRINPEFLQTRDLTLKLKASTFRISRVDYQFEEDVDLDFVSDPKHDTDVSVYLIIDNGTFDIFVDEIVRNGIDTIFEFEKNRIKILERIAYFTLPAGCTSLDDVTVNVISMKKQETLTSV